MVPREQTAEKVLFGRFEVNLATGEVSKNGRKLRLSGQPAEVLVILLEHAGRLVTREELRERLWREETFVDFDHGLNNCINRIREVLGDSAGSPEWIETLPKKGYRFIAPVRPVIPSEEEDPAGAPEPGAPDIRPSGLNLIVEPDGWLLAPGLSPVEEQQDPSAERPPVAEIRPGPRNWQARKWLSVTALSLLVLAAAGTYVFTRSTQAPSKIPKINSLAVLPLKNLSGDPSQEYFAEGMTEEVIGRLSMIRGLRVISRTSVMQFRNTQPSVPEIAKMLHVDGIVEGSVMREGSHVRVHAQLIHGATDQHIWSESYDRELRDTLALESEVAQSIARKVEVTVTGEERARLVGAREVSPDVYESYLKGRGAIARANSRAEIEKSVTYFEGAIREDPTFAPAYVGLAAAYARLGTVFVGAVPPQDARQKVISAARKALELDPDLAESHTQLAFVYMQSWQWRDAEAEYRRALQLNPNDAAAYRGFGGGWLMLQGRMEEALAVSQRALELDPLGEAGTDLGWVLFHARRYDEAIRELRSVIAVHPDDANSRTVLGQVLICTGQSQEAISLLEQAASMTDRSPGSIQWLAVAYARAGRPTEAVRLIDELKRRQKTNYVPPAVYVYPFLQLGDYDQAFAWLERAYQEQSNIMMFLRVGPFFDPVRNDPRFKDLLRRVGLD